MRIYLDSVDSTNDHAMRLAAEGALSGTVVFAEEQTKGKGRRGRSWNTEKGSNLIMSLLLRPKIRPEHASRLTLLMAVAAARAIYDVTGLKGLIKWPNDVVVNGRKVCGILTEMRMKGTMIDHVVVGIGINVNQKDFPDEISSTAGSLCLELGRSVDKEALADAVLTHMEKLYQVFLQTEDLSQIRTEYNEICANCGHEIRVLEPGNEYVGTTEGINEKGELVVEKKNGEKVCVYAGEVSVRGLYGYV